MNYFVMLIGPYDQAVFGPFDDKPQAEAYAHSKKHNRNDVWVLSKSELDKNFAEFGTLPIDEPMER